MIFKAPSNPNHSVIIHALNAFCYAHVCSQKRNEPGGDRTRPQQCCETKQSSWAVTRGSPCSLPTIFHSKVLQCCLSGSACFQLPMEHTRLLHIPFMSYESTLQNNGRIHTGHLILSCSELLLIYTKQIRAKSAQILHRCLCWNNKPVSHKLNDFLLCFQNKILNICLF